MKNYNYEWKTVNDIISNLDTKVVFRDWDNEVVTLREIFRRFESTDVLKDVKYTHSIWLKIKNAFNEEASSYDENAFDSVLQSTGSVCRREISSSKCWDLFGGDDYGDYSIIAAIIGILHHGEELETGTILFCF